MKKIMNAFKHIFLYSLIIFTFSCDHWSSKVEGRQNALYYLLATTRIEPYDTACDDPSKLTGLSLNSPVSITNSLESKKYKFTTDSNGLKYSFTLSADYL